MGMTVAQIEESSRSYLTIEDVGRLVGIRPDMLRWQAQQDPQRLGFPVCVAGNTVRIPRLGFLHWLTYGNAPIVAENVPQTAGTT